MEIIVVKYLYVHEIDIRQENSCCCASGGIAESTHCGLVRESTFLSIKILIPAENRSLIF